MFEFNRAAADLVAFEALQRALADAPELANASLETTVRELRRAQVIDASAARYLLRHADRFCRCDPEGTFAPAWLV